jgi:hypothetical protein
MLKKKPDNIILSQMSVEPEKLKTSRPPDK